MKIFFSSFIVLILLPISFALASWEQSKEEVEKALAEKFDFDHVKILTKRIDPKWQFKEWKLSEGESRVYLEFADYAGNPLSIKAPYEEAILVCVPKVKIAAGKRIEYIDTDLVTIPKKNFRNEYLKSFPEGTWTTKKTLMEGKPISIADLVKPNLIAKGSEVRVIYTHGNLVIEGKAIALENGSENQIIKLRNPDSKVLVTAKVLKEGVAIVN